MQMGIDYCAMLSGIGHALQRIDVSAEKFCDPRCELKSEQ